MKSFSDLDHDNKHLVKFFDQAMEDDLGGFKEIKEKVIDWYRK